METKKRLSKRKSEEVGVAAFVYSIIVGAILFTAGFSLYEAGVPTGWEHWLAYGSFYWGAYFLMVWGVIMILVGIFELLNPPEVVYLRK